MRQNIPPKKDNKHRLITLSTLFLLLCCFLLTSCTINIRDGQDIPDRPGYQGSVTLSDIPEYSGEPYIVINGNEPDFREEQEQQQAIRSFETYSDLDSLGRCGTAYACIGTDLMPTEPRGKIGHIKPTGWQTAKYDCVDGKYLYNRCHLIGFQLSGENANEKNLITGTRYMNVEGMLPFENLVADHVKETGNHVWYRVTPIFDGDDLLARGVQMEAMSAEDSGREISYNVFVYNVQPGIILDYATGENSLDKTTSAQAAAPEGEAAGYRKAKR